MVDKFNDDDSVRVCVASIRAAGEGINLHKNCNTVVFTELWWNPGTHNQAEDRVHRIGQNEHVDIYYLIADNTIESDIWEMIDEKQKVIDKAIDGIYDDDDVRGFVSELIDKIRAKGD
jgi:SNF2 family DNA or RNA helicase